MLHCPLLNAIKWNIFRNCLVKCLNKIIFQIIQYLTIIFYTVQTYLFSKITLCCFLAYRYIGLTVLWAVSAKLMRIYLTSSVRLVSCRAYNDIDNESNDIKQLSRSKRLYLHGKMLQITVSAKLMHIYLMSSARLVIVSCRVYNWKKLISIVNV